MTERGDVRKGLKKKVEKRGVRTFIDVKSGG
jgi:hypothetical protein